MVKWLDKLAFIEGLGFVSVAAEGQRRGAQMN